MAVDVDKAGRRVHAAGVVNFRRRFVDGRRHPFDPAGRDGDVAEIRRRSGTVHHLAVFKK
ncbi:MAG: hypothetical protein LUG50_15235 [Planctomycetaceae bacterium]|nr:hypothetical protein [Planctomycetaceae bacterium]